MHCFRYRDAMLAAESDVVGVHVLRSVASRLQRPLSLPSEWMMAPAFLSSEGLRR